MHRMDTNVVLFCCDGLFQRDLMWRLCDAFRLQAVVLQVDQSARADLWKRLSRYANPRILSQYILARSKRRSYDLRAKLTLESLFFRNGRAPNFPPGVPIILVDNINSAATEGVLDQF